MFFLLRSESICVEDQHVTCSIEDRIFSNISDYVIKILINPAYVSYHRSDSSFLSVLGYI